MDLIPSIDIRGGRSVRLYQGRFDDETDYGDPVTQAVELSDKGATLLHVVDLDAARSGEAVNDATVRAVIAAASAPVEASGGVRSAARAIELFELGATRVVLGTAAIEDPGLATELAGRYPGRVVVGLDYRRHGEHRVVVVRGWETTSSLELTEALVRFDDAPLAAVVATDVGRDSTMAGADLEGYVVLLGASPHPVIASGGVGGAPDLAALAALDIGGRHLAGVIVGRALQSGAMTFEEALSACAP